MSEGTAPVGGSSSRMGAGEAEVGVVGGIAVAVASLWGGLWMLGGRDVAVLRAVLRKRSEGGGMDRRRLDGGVDVFRCLATSTFRFFLRDYGVGHKLSVIFILVLLSVRSFSGILKFSFFLFLFSRGMFTLWKYVKEIKAYNNRYNENKVK